MDIEYIDIKEVNVFVFDKCRSIDSSFRRSGAYISIALNLQKLQIFDHFFQEIRRYLLEDDSRSFESKKKAIEVSVDQVCDYIASSERQTPLDTIYKELMKKPQGLVDLVISKADREFYFAYKCLSNLDVPIPRIKRDKKFT